MSIVYQGPRPKQQDGTLPPLRARAFTLHCGRVWRATIGLRRRHYVIQARGPVDLALQIVRGLRQ